MIGNVRSRTSINAVISSKGSLKASIGASTILGSISLGTVEIVRLDFPRYDGEYEATPTVDEQILPTKNRSMFDDFVIHEIPYSQTTNLSGGYTATIGG